MPDTPNLTLLGTAALGCGLLIYAWWRQKKYQPGGKAPTISPVFLMFLGLVLMLVAAAEALSLMGVTWTPPYQR